MPTPNPWNQLRGAQNRAAGAIFEQYIDATCDEYRRQGVANIEKTPEPMHPVKAMGAGKYIAVFTSAAQPDYKGTLSGGRAVCFEAKHTDDDRILQRRVTAEQAEALERHHRLGALCFVLISIRMQAFYRVPWTVWREMKKHYGHKYMSAADLEAYRLKTTWPMGSIINFLQGVIDSE